MNQDIICIYYSRTGKTKQAIGEIAQALDCECVQLRDHVNRTGALGWLLCGLDAMHKGTRRLRTFETARPLNQYKLVILGTPVWAGRCSSVMRGLLKRRGFEMQNVAYVITRGTENLYKEVFDQMDQYVLSPRKAEATLMIDSVGYHFWRDQFIRSVQEFVAK